MKTINYFFFAALITAFVISCEGPEGPQGPQGEQGIQGEQGEQGDVGPQGVSGNANVVLYEYGEQTFTSALNYLMPDISQGRIDSSIVLTYYNPSTEASTAWYAIPGAGSGGGYLLRNFWYQTTIEPSNYSMGVRAQNFDGTSNTTSKTFTKLRIFVVVASEIIPGDATKSAIDLDDYDAVCEFLDIPKE
jgi:hypothetical protein